MSATSGHDPKNGAQDEMHPAARMLFGWVSAKSSPAILFWGAIVVVIGLIAADLALHRHDKLSLAKTFGFYAFWGFGAFALAVLTGWPLGRLLRRDEDYYEEGDATPVENRQAGGREDAE